MKAEVLAKAVLIDHVSLTLKTKGIHEAANLARQLSTQLFLAAGIELTDASSVHEERGSIDLTGEWE